MPRSVHPPLSYAGAVGAFQQEHTRPAHKLARENCTGAANQRILRLVGPIHQRGGMRQKALKEHLAALSVRVLPGGAAPTLETLPPSEALVKVRAFAEQRRDEQGLVLLGEVGVGK